MNSMSYSIRADYPGFILNEILWIAPESDSTSNSLVVISEEEALRNSEEILQLKEGCSYEYEILDENKQLGVLEGIIHPSRKNHIGEGSLHATMLVGYLCQSLHPQAKPIIMLWKFDRPSPITELSIGKC